MPKHCRLPIANFKSAIANRQSPMPSVSHRHLSLERDRFLVVWIDRDRTQRKLPRLASITTLEENSCRAEYARRSVSDPRRSPSSMLQSRPPDRCGEDLSSRSAGTLRRSSARSSPRDEVPATLLRHVRPDKDHALLSAGPGLRNLAIRSQQHLRSRFNPKTSSRFSTSRIRRLTPLVVCDFCHSVSHFA